MCAHDLFGHLRALIEAVHNRFVLVADHFELRVIGGVKADIGPHLLAQHLDLVGATLQLLAGRAAHIGTLRRQRCDTQ